MTLTETEQARYDAFIAAVRGFDAHTVARAMNEMTSGIDWRGCKRANLAEKFATAHRPLGRSILTYVDLARLRRMLLAKKAGDCYWLSVK